MVSTHVRTDSSPFLRRVEVGGNWCLCVVVRVGRNWWCTYIPSGPRTSPAISKLELMVPTVSYWNRPFMHPSNGKPPNFLHSACGHRLASCQQAIHSSIQSIRHQFKKKEERFIQFYRHELAQRSTIHSISWTPPPPEWASDSAARLSSHRKEKVNTMLTSIMSSSWCRPSIDEAPTATWHAAMSVQQDLGRVGRIACTNSAVGWAIWRPAKAARGLTE